jgi:hypothetical protein
MTIESDAELLANLKAKLQLVKDRVRGVAEGYSPGLFLWGEGGGGKSYTVETTLKEMRKPYRLTNSRLTGRGLFDLLRDQPEALHVIDDCETLFADKHALGVLRSALWGLPGRDGRQRRVVVWQVADDRKEFVFTGSVILIGNSPPADTPQLLAVKTRVPVVNFTPTTEELAAQMRLLAGLGHQHGPHRLPPEDCMKVVEELLARSQRLDLRQYVNACNDYLQWSNGAAESHWLDLLESRLQQRTVVSAGKPGGRAERKQAELALVRRIAGLAPQERLAVWQQETGKSQAALYRRLDDLKGLASTALTPGAASGWEREVRKGEEGSTRAVALLGAGA